MADLRDIGSAAAVAAALESDAVAAAMREADFERLHRERIEAALAAMRDTAERLRQRLRACQKELKAVKEGSSAQAPKLHTREEFEKLQVDLDLAFSHLGIL